MKDLSRHEIIVKYRERREKFAYCLMGLNVAAIGFTLSKTYETKEIHLIHSLLRIALFSWLSSIMYSFRWILTEFKGMQLDMHQYDIDAGTIESWFEEEIPEGYKEAIQEAVNIEKEKKAKRSEKDYKRVLLFFITGIIFFIIWRIMEITH